MPIISDMPIISKISDEELREIASRLEMHNAVFSQLFQISSHIFDETVKTAAVSFDDVGQVLALLINPKFWATLSAVQKDFVLCHEMLHAILEHGRRAVDIASCNQDATNVCMDVVVNELLVRRFGFSRHEIDPKDTLCWLNTIFKKCTNVAPEMTFEYYYNKLPKTKMPFGIGNLVQEGGRVLDDHSKLSSGELSGLAKEIADKLSSEERQQFKDKLGEEGQQSERGGLQAGVNAGGFIKTMTMEYIKPKRKWESLIKTCLKKIADEGVEESWLDIFNRRISAIKSSKIILPTEIDAETRTKNRALVYMFLDTSGSCYDLAPRFWRLAKSVPKDIFDLRLKCFDTRVYNINLKDLKLYGFGGTRFSILERHIQSELKEGDKYPDGVFVLTDGYGDPVTPQYPKKWHVLLTNKYKSCFPEDVNFYDLSLFE